jgi:CPA2 family monovalent cation:H+ antiporter-2
MDGVLFQATIFLVAMVVAVPLAARLGFGSVLGYLAAGIVIGPGLGLVGGIQTAELQHIAEFGVVMMLFLIGLELEPRALWDMRHRLLGLGGLQIGLTTAAIMLGGLWLGQAWTVALAAGMTLALSSTAIVLQTRCWRCCRCCNCRARQRWFSTPCSSARTRRNRPPGPPRTRRRRISSPGCRAGRRRW